MLLPEIIVKACRYFWLVFCTISSGSSGPGGERTGNGNYTYAASGDVYQGELKGNKKFGRGTYRWRNCNTYDGNWEDDKKTGRGKMTFANGNTYEGDWKNDTITGRGKMTFANGSTYEGDWENDKRSKMR